MNAWALDWANDLLRAPVEVPGARPTAANVKLVGLVLAHLSDPEHVVAFGVDEIAAKASLTRATTRRAIRALEELGWVERRAGGGRGVKNSYLLRRP